MKKLSIKLLKVLGDMCFLCLKKACRGQLWIDRKVLKRYLQIETPFYKMWWKSHCEVMQRKLDYEANMREGYELGRVF